MTQPIYLDKQLKSSNDPMFSDKGDLTDSVNHTRLTLKQSDY